MSFSFVFVVVSASISDRICYMISFFTKLPLYLREVEKANSPAFIPLLKAVITPTVSGKQTKKQTKPKQQNKTKPHTHTNKSNKKTQKREKTPKYFLWFFTKHRAWRGKITHLHTFTITTHTTSPISSAIPIRPLWIWMGSDASSYQPTVPSLWEMMAGLIASSVEDQCCLPQVMDSDNHEVVKISKFICRQQQQI